MDVSSVSAQKRGKMNIVLIGFMGCGKSTIGVKLSYFMKQPLIDTDKQIERKAGCSINEIFAKQGEECFRRMETEYLEKLLQEKGSFILSTGGGLPMREENAKLLKQIGKVVLLRVDADTVYERLKNDTTRPLLQGDNPKAKIEELLTYREPFYEACADVIVDVEGKSFREILEEIQERTGA